MADNGISEVPALLTSSPRELSNNQGQLCCEYCKASKTGRNLIVSFDGTSNQFGQNNTNVVELYSRIIKDNSQLTYYNSGIGTYARPSWKSFTYLKQVLSNKVDLATAWNFEKVVLAGYRWLSDNYKPGDKIFFFGFSRGAYQARTLAGMIKEVGLIIPGNEEQIPFAYELYASLSNQTFHMAKRFKRTFSREVAMVHFLGAWDTVSSVGVIRRKILPATNDSICYFRHALALDERRVNFLPEYALGSYNTAPFTAEGELQPNLPDREMGMDDSGPSGHASRRPENTGEMFQATSVPHVKEVWFAGTHSDIGGGSRSNAELNNATVPLLWMENEAMIAGLRLLPSRVEWNWDKLKNARPTASLVGGWHLLEYLPFKRLSYRGLNKVTWWPHYGRGRVIVHGQKIHASVAFMDGYHPRASISKGIGVEGWSNIIGRGNYGSVGWAKGLEDILEVDFFDFSNVDVIVKQVNEDMHNLRLTDHLEVVASTPEGTEAISKADPEFALFSKMLKSDEEVAVAGAAILSKLAVCGTTSCRSEAMQTGFILLLAKILKSADLNVRIRSSKAIKDLFKDSQLRNEMVDAGVLMSLVIMTKHGHGQELDAGRVALCEFIEHGDGQQLVKHPTTF